MELKEVQKYLKDNAGAEDVKDYVRGFITPDEVKNFLSSDAGTKIMQPLIDSNFTKGLETWKTNNLKKLTDIEVEREINERYPAETATEKRLKSMESDLNSEKKKRIKAELKTTALAEATKEGLPTNLVDFFIGEDEDSTKAGMAEFKTTWNASLGKAVEGKFKDGGRNPNNTTQKNTSQDGLYTVDEVKKMSQSEVLKNLDKITKSQATWK